MSAVTRLRNEYNNFIAYEAIGANRELVNGNIFEWIITIRGPLNSPYRNGTFRIRVKCSDHYPSAKPDVHFITPIFHPNVSPSDSHVCYGYLDNWESQCNLSELAIQLFNLLGQPNPSSPLNQDAHDMWFDKNDTDHKAYESMIEAYTNTFN